MEIVGARLALKSDNLTALMLLIKPFKGLTAALALHIPRDVAVLTLPKHALLNFSRLRQRPTGKLQPPLPLRMNHLAFFLLIVLLNLSVFVVDALASSQQFLFLQQTTLLR